jgi:hypothetical protein
VSDLSNSNDHMSMSQEIEAFALLNILDIFQFVLTAKDDEIEERYGSEERAINTAEKYIDIASRSSMLEYHLAGWSIKYSQPIKGETDKTIEKTGYFYTKTGEKKDE